MIKFIKITIAFSLPIFLGYIIMEGMLRNIPNDYSYKKKYLDKNAASIKTLVLGSSHTFYGVNPDFLGANAYNLAFVSQSLDYDWELFKKYQGDFKNLKTIIIPISYFSLFYKLENGDDLWRQKYYYLYFDLKVSTAFQYRFEVTSLSAKENIRRVKSYYINNNIPKESNSLGMGFRVDKIRTNLKEVGVKSALLHKEISEIKNLNENIKVVKRFISYAGSHDLKVVFVTTPTTPYYYKMLGSAQLELMKNTMQTFDSANANVKYYNFLKDEKFAINDFRDADHLNKKGAEKFTKLLNNLISN
jgi:hypothetical protein